jgi:hypothetical protein
MYLSSHHFKYLAFFVEEQICFLSHFEMYNTLSFTALTILNNRALKEKVVFLYTTLVPFDHHLPILPIPHPLVAILK